LFLVQLFRAVADGPMDFGMIEDRDRYGDLEEDRRRLDQAVSFDSETDQANTIMRSAETDKRLAGREQSNRYGLPAR
jgi:hypothetical protein